MSTTCSAVQEFKMQTKVLQTEEKAEVFDTELVCMRAQSNFTDSFRVHTKRPLLMHTFAN